MLNVEFPCKSFKFSFRKMLFHICIDFMLLCCSFEQSNRERSLARSSNNLVSSSNQRLPRDITPKMNQISLYDGNAPHHSSSNLTSTQSPSFMNGYRAPSCSGEKSDILLKILMQMTGWMVFFFELCSPKRKEIIDCLIITGLAFC